jgi:hypothetical protein
MGTLSQNDAKNGRFDYVWAIVFYRHVFCGENSSDSRKGILLGLALDTCGGFMRIYYDAITKVIKSRSTKYKTGRVEISAKRKLS